MYMTLSWRPEDQQNSTAVQAEILTAIATLRFKNVYVPFLGHIICRIKHTHWGDIKKLEDKLNETNLGFSFLLYRVRRGNRIFHSSDFPRGFSVPDGGPPDAPVDGSNGLFRVGSITQSANLPNDLLKQISDG